MDCEMPEVDGYEATQQLRGLEEQGDLGREQLVKAAETPLEALEDEFVRAQAAMQQFLQASRHEP